MENKYEDIERIISRYQLSFYTLEDCVNQFISNEISTDDVFSYVVNRGCEVTDCSYTVFGYYIARYKDIY